MFETWEQVEFWESVNAVEKEEATIRALETLTVDDQEVVKDMDIEMKNEEHTQQEAMEVEQVSRKRSRRSRQPRARRREVSCSLNEYYCQVCQSYSPRPMWSSRQDIVSCCSSGSPKDLELCSDWVVLLNSQEQPSESQPPDTGAVSVHQDNKAALTVGYLTARAGKGEEECGEGVDKAEADHHEQQPGDHLPGDHRQREDLASLVATLRRISAELKSSYDKTDQVLKANRDLSYRVQEEEDEDDSSDFSIGGDDDGEEYEDPPAWEEYSSSHSTKPRLQPAKFHTHIFSTSSPVFSTSSPVQSSNFNFRESSDLSPEAKWFGRRK